LSTIIKKVNYVQTEHSNEDQHMVCNCAVDSACYSSAGSLWRLFSTYDRIAYDFDLYDRDLYDNCQPE